MEKCLGLFASSNPTNLGLIGGIEKKKNVFMENALFIISKFAQNKWAVNVYLTTPKHRPTKIENQNKCKSS